MAATVTTAVPAAPSTAVHRQRVIAVAAVVAAALLVLVAALWGRALEAHGVRLHLHGGAPLTGVPRRALAGPAFLAPVLVAVALVAVLPVIARRARWRTLLATTPALTAAWAIALSVVDGARGLTGPLRAPSEYLTDVHRVGPGFLSSFTDHVVQHSDGTSWTTQVAGHPPGALLVFAGLERIGLGGAAWASGVCIAAGALAVPAVLVSVRRVVDEETARRAAIWLVLLPAAVWVATSADALFTGVAALGVALAASARAASGGRALGLAVASGGVLGASLYLSYGLVLLGPLALVVLRRPRLVLAGIAGVGAVVAAFTLAGFAWWSGLAATHERVLQGVAPGRPLSYFLVADLAALGIALGPAVVAGAVHVRSAAPRLALLVLPVVAAVLVADASSLSKGEVERIWLPFVPWLALAAAALPSTRTRWWLGAQAATAIAVVMTLRTAW